VTEAAFHGPRVGVNRDMLQAFAKMPTGILDCDVPSQSSLECNVTHTISMYNLTRRCTDGETWQSKVSQYVCQGGFN
jgi:hypothetical protein